MDIREFTTRLLGTRVKESDRMLKSLHNQANDIAQQGYVRGSKHFLGLGFVPRSEDFRNKAAHSDPRLKPIFNQMDLVQRQRRIDSRDTNRARLAAGGISLGVGAAIGGAAYLRNRKKQKEQEEQYGLSSVASEVLDEMYKEAAFKDKFKSFGKSVVEQGKAVKKNFAHPEELDHLYGGSRAQRVKDILTFKRAKEAHKILKHSNESHKVLRSLNSGKFTKMNDTHGNSALENLNDYTETLNKLNDSMEQRLTLLRKVKTIPGQDLKEAKYVYNNGGSENSKAYIDRQKFRKRQEGQFNRMKESASKIHSHLDDRYNQIRKTRDNELVKSLAPYVAATALTAGGVYLYKKHKKKKESEESDKN